MTDFIAFSPDKSSVAFKNGIRNEVSFSFPNISLNTKSIFGFINSVLFISSLLFLKALHHYNIMGFNPHVIILQVVIRMKKRIPYGIEKKDAFDELFSGLWIHANPTEERNSYLVLRLDFSGIETDKGKEALFNSFLWKVKMKANIPSHRRIR
jgi:hypothetical protein